MKQFSLDEFTSVKKEKSAFPSSKNDSDLPLLH